MDEVAITIISAFGAIVAAGIPIYLIRKRYPSQRIQDGSSIVEAAEGVVGLLRDELGRLSDDVGALRAELGAEERRTDELEKQLKSMRQQLAAYRRGVGLLINQLVALGHHPAWEPDDEIDGTPI